MISRRNIYDSFVSYMQESITKLSDDKAFYTDRLIISNNQLDITKDIIIRNADKIAIVYSIDSSNFINKSVSKIDIINRRVFIRNNKKLLLANLTKLDDTYGEHSIIFINGIIDNYFNIITEIKDLTRKLQLITDKLEFFTRYKGLSKNVVYYILSQNNRYYEKLILDGETIYLGNHMGNIKVVPKKVNGKTNWHESFAYRDKLVAEGKIPYNKEDHLKAKANGETYDGVKWFIKYENDIQHYINWYAYSKQLLNKDVYTFSPARYNKTGMTTTSIKEQVTSIKELDNLKLGIVNKLNLGLDINEMQFLKYSTYDI